MDLYDESTSDLTLRLDASKALGIGAFGVVLKGTWGYSRMKQETRVRRPHQLVMCHSHCSVMHLLLLQMKVAVKFFIKAGETKDVAVILERMKHGASNFYETYNQIRAEVAVLSKLQHPNLTHLEGVTMQPHPGLLLPLAPQGSLHNVLKEYSSADVSVLPLTLQASARQVSSANRHPDIKNAWIFALDNFCNYTPMWRSTHSSL